MPDFEKVLTIYNENNKDMSIINPILMGHQNYRHNFHYVAFNYGYLETLLKQVGFSMIKSWEPGEAEYYEFDDWASRQKIVNGRAYPVSLNVEAVK